MEKAPRKYVRKKKAAPALLSDSGLSLTELKTRSMQALMELAEQYEIENASSMRKQELIFALLQACLPKRCHLRGWRPGDPARRLRLPALSPVQLHARPGRHLCFSLPDPPLFPA